MVKEILCPWSKVSQISKLNVWLLACILRWAIQGLLALLFFLQLEQMELEIKELPGKDKQKYRTRLTSYKAELSKLQADLVIILHTLKVLFIAVYIWEEGL